MLVPSSTPCGVSPYALVVLRASSAISLLRATEEDGEEVDAAPAVGELGWHRASDVLALCADTLVGCRYYSVVVLVPSSKIRYLLYWRRLAFGKLEFDVR